MITGSEAINWLTEPEEKDYAAAESFLSMLIAPGSLAGVIKGLRATPMRRWAAKDILRAAGLPALSAKDSAEVAEKLEKVKRSKPISPILAVGGLREVLVIADGYHRTSAAYQIHEDSVVPGRLFWMPR